MMRRARSSLASIVLLSGLASIADAQAGIRVQVAERVRVDGALGDWSGGFASVGSGSDASMEVALASDDTGLYVAARVLDDRMVRTARPGAVEDVVILTLALPGRRGLEGLDVYLFAGVTGRSAASVSIAPIGARRLTAMRGARIVEGPRPRGTGYLLEAFLPFSALTNGARWDEGRGSFRLRDVDAEAHPSVESEPALVEVDAQHLERLVPLLASGGPSAHLESFLAERNLGATRPTHDLRGDVSGDTREERVFVVDRFVVIAGPGIQNGQGYAYHELPVARAADVRSAVLEELTGDGPRELALVLRQQNARGERDLYRVLSLGGDAPRPLFSVEIRKAIGEGVIESRVRVHRGRGAAPPEIEVSAQPARGLDPSAYHEEPPTDVEPILLPWGPVSSRRYRWDGRRFTAVSQRDNPSYQPPRVEAPAVRVQVALPPDDPPAAAPPGMDRLLAAFRRERRIAANARPRYRFATNLIGRPAPETALVYGRDLVVVGPDVRGGTSWLHFEIPAPSDGDLLGVEAADVTRDGAAELLFSVRQVIGDVTRTVLLVYQLRDGAFPRILEVEIARQRGADRVTNQVVTAGGSLEIRPGDARGFGAENWPFTAGNDPVRPLLLPWRDGVARYRYRGGVLTH